MIEDLDLIKSAKNGDKESLNTLMNNYKKIVNKIARRYFIIGADLSDVIQEGMIGLFSAYENFDESKNVQFKTFASICINRQIITAIKKAYKNSKSCLIDDVNEQVINTNTIFISPEENFILNEEYKILREEINQKLSKLEQKILTEFLENKSYDEISNLLNISKKSVDNALTRIRSKLKYLVSKPN